MRISRKWFNQFMDVQDLSIEEMAKIGETELDNKETEEDNKVVITNINELPIQKPPMTHLEEVTYEEKEIKNNEPYVLPPLDLLVGSKNRGKVDSTEFITRNNKILEQVFNDFGIMGRVKEVHVGPTVTQYEIEIKAGTKVNKILSINREIALALAAKDVRIQAPIPGKSTIGIEIPNPKTSEVKMKDILAGIPKKLDSSKLLAPLGLDIMGNIQYFEINKAPHMLIAGSTGSGKSVCINNIITSILMRAKPDEVKMILVDPKKVELSMYNGVPHLLAPVVTDPKKAANALNWAVAEMNKRYKSFAELGVKDITSYNEKSETKLPKIVIIIDELADLMMACANEVEDYICRLAQMARAAGMHLIIATQRPSVDVITGVIKANVPSRIAFAVSSQTDSRTILDMGGAEKLLGKGDMLFYPLGAAKPIRLQGAYISEEDSDKVIDFVKSQVKEEVQYEDEIIQTISKTTNIKNDDVDEFLEDAIAFVVQSGQGSSSMLQRKYKIGFNRAARLIDSMEERGIVGPSEGSKPRKVLITKEELENLKRES